MNMIEAPSPNFDDRDWAIDMVVLHYTGMPTGGQALARLCDPASRVSAHYLVEENGDVFQLVDEMKRAWHAGAARWQGADNINARSIGIEIVNPGHEWGYRDFPAVQIDSVIILLRGIFSRHAISPARVLGHSDVAPRRKDDPGEKFPWRKLAQEGLALAPFDGDPKAGEAVDYFDAVDQLNAIGYDAGSGDFTAALVAFQRRFCPQSLGQSIDPRTKAALMAVGKMLND